MSDCTGQGGNAVEIRVREVMAGHARGWSFVPLRGKVPAQKGWSKAPRPSAEDCERWAREGNIGLRTGQASGVIVIDVDEGADLQGLDLPATVTVETGRGRHLYYRAPVQPIGNSAGKLAPHVDVRGDGGQVAFVGSIHPETGRAYRWAEGLSPDDLPLAPLPAWIRERPARKPSTPRSRQGGNGTSPYGLKALEDEVAKVRAAVEGERNDQLNRSAFVLGQLVEGGELNEEQARGGLLEATTLPEAEAQATITSGLEAGAREPRAAPQGRGTTAGGETPHLTDVGNGIRLVQRHGQDMRYCPPWKQWLVWDGRRWAQDETGELVRRAKETVRAMYREAASIEDTDARSKFVKWAHQSEAMYRIEQMVKAAQSEPGVSMRPDQFDCDPWLLNVLNGTLDLRAGKLRPHDRKDLITKLAPVEYDPSAECPTWGDFLDRVFGGDEQLIAYVQRVAGYCLTGSTREQCIFLLHGNGSNGKSVLLNTLRALLGDYAQQTPASTFMVKRAAESATNDLAGLRGARFVTAVETEDGQRLSEPVMKQLAGEDEVTARFLYKEFFTYLPAFKVALATNNKPTIRGTDHGIWRRVRLIPFEVTIPDEEQDRELGQKLRAELPGILNWAVQGCLDWLEDGSLRDPDVVLAATNEYRREQDRFADFVDECCTVADHASVEATELFLAYKRWAEDRGEHPFSQRRFGAWLGQQGYMRTRGGTGRKVWQGIALQVEGRR